MNWNRFFSVVVGTLLTSTLSAQLPGEHAPGQLLVKLQPGVEVEAWTAEVRAEGWDVSLISTPSRSSNIHLIAAPDAELEAALRDLARHPDVEAAQFDHYVEERLVPNDPNFGQQWHHVQSADHDIDSDKAWDITTGGYTANGDRIVVCVIEGGGSNYNHVDLIANHWTNPHEIDGNGIDDDNNGYVDDFNGWNPGSNSDNIAAGGHGTSVSGMIGATGDNGIGGAGVNWDVGIMQVDMAGINESNVIAAYEYPKVMREQYTATGGELGAFVVATNASWGIDQADPSNYPIWCAFYDELGASGILNCGATTNQNLNVDAVGDMPTACDSDYMISVTATNNNDVRTFSGYGATTIDLAAPGDNVYLPSGSSGYGSTSGTSFASPCVAGAIGLIYSAPCPDLAALAMANPGAAADLVRGYLLDGVDPVPNLADETVTGGRLNLDNSLTLALANCGPVECTIEGFEVASDCWYNAALDTVSTSVTFTAHFSSFLCSADSLCWGGDTLVCTALADLGGAMADAAPWTVEQWEGEAEFSVYFTADSLHSDTLVVTLPDCAALVPGCTNPDAFNYDESATIDDGSCELPCTDVVFTVTTDCYPDETSWSITDVEGTQLAAGGDYQDDQTEYTWTGCLTNACLTLTVGDGYGDGLNGSIWFGCNADGDYALTTADGLVLAAMGDPDFGSSVSHAFCLPPVPGCTDGAACNFDPEANADDGTCLIPGTPCDDADAETVNDIITADCGCLGEPIVEGCMDPEACNYAPEANVDFGCFYVGLGTIAYDVPPMAGSQTVFTYSGFDAGNALEWSVIGGSIVGDATGSAVTVLWDATTLNGTVQVTELGADDCTDEVSESYNVLPNQVAEWQRLGLELYPNPGHAGFTVAGATGQITVTDATGRRVLQQRLTAEQTWVDTGDWPAGVYAIAFDNGTECMTRQWMLVR